MEGKAPIVCTKLTITYLERFIDNEKARPPNFSPVFISGDRQDCQDRSQPLSVVQSMRLGPLEAKRSFSNGI